MQVAGPVTRRRAMICCVLLLLVVGVARAALLTVLPGRSRHERTPFPPAAQRTVADEARPLAAVSSAQVPSPVQVVPGAWRQRIGSSLAVAGVVWFVIGIIAMHVLGIVPTSIDVDPWRDVAFHLSGPLVGSVGLVLRAPARARRRLQPVSQVETGTAT